MKFHKLTLSVMFAIAAAISTQSAALSQNFKNPTHPTLSEVTRGSEINKSRVVGAQVMESQTTPGTFSNGRTFFSHPPMLVRAATSQSGGYIPSTYEFTLNVPANAGQPLKAVTIAQAENFETIMFDANASKAFAGEKFAAGPEIPLASVGGEQPQNPGEVTIVFDQPVQPGSTVTVAVAAKSNPNFGGAYDFGVTAYPTGENSMGQFLGYGRINFYGNSN